MALYVKRDEQRSQLQEKVATELQERLRSKDISAKEVDPAFLENAHQTRPAGMIIMILLFLMALVIVWIMVSIVTRN